MKRILLAIEGPDSVGKTTLVNTFASKLGARVLQQPNSSGSLGFIRDLVKKDKNINPFSRQLLHACGAIKDIFENFDGQPLIMDRWLYLIFSLW